MGWKTPVQMEFVKNHPPDEGSPRACSSEFSYRVRSSWKSTMVPDDYFIDVEEVGGSKYQRS
jgi:hypothetical protein